MTPTSLKILRDTKLTDGTLVRWMSNGDENVVILSVKNKNAQEGSDNEFGEVTLPDTVELAMELLNMAHKMLQKNLQRELGPIHVVDWSKLTPEEKESIIKRGMLIDGSK